VPNTRPSKFPTRAFGAAIVLTLLLLGVAVVHTWRMHGGFREIVSTDLRLVELRGEIMHLDEVLTMSARLSATSGDLSWETRYKRHEPRLDAAIKEAMRLAPDAYTSSSAANTDAANLALVALEQRSFELVRQGRADDARKLVFGNEYAQHKKTYSDGMEATMQALRSRAEMTTESYADNMLEAVLIAVVVLVFLVCGWVNVMRLMRRFLGERNSAIANLRVANETLEQRVHDRTVELAASLEALRKAQDQLVSTARGAGMAEVAAGVLHNVGNVLNSINVSAHVTDEALKTCRVANVRKAADMLAGAKSDLPAFLATERGKLLASYLCEATANMTTAHERACAELEHLKTSVEHVRVIVSTQQTYAHASAQHVETFDLADLVTSAIRLGTRHAITIANRVPAGIAMTTDKHRLMQILLNLISNACHAVSAAPTTSSREVAIEATASDGNVAIRVVDHGVGIDGETFKKLFRHGFTTKRDGHGFGLHSSAIAATELGGGIRAESEGRGRGATFVLEIPLSLPSTPMELARAS
jgi:C4-dicarboxylate-specific signal transduction histidine kinase